MASKPYKRITVTSNLKFSDLEVINAGESQSVALFRSGLWFSAVKMAVYGPFYPQRIADFFTNSIKTS